MRIERGGAGGQFGQTLVLQDVPALGRPDRVVVAADGRLAVQPEPALALMRP